MRGSIRSLIGFSYFSMIIVGLAGTAHSAEKYSATVNDGTAETIHATTEVDRETPEYLSAPAPRQIRSSSRKASRLRAPSRLSANVAQSGPSDDTAADAAALRQSVRENRYERRLKDLEQAKVEKTATDPEISPETTSESESSDERGAENAAVDDASDTPASDPQDAIELDADAAVAGSLPDIAPEGEISTEEDESALVSSDAALDNRGNERTTARKELAKVRAAQTGYDAVPGKHVSEVAERLKYTNDILKRFGRAYDYRSTTLSQFRKILAELESGAEKTKNTN